MLVVGTGEPEGTHAEGTLMTLRKTILAIFAALALAACNASTPDDEAAPTRFSVDGAGQPRMFELSESESFPVSEPAML
jgi:hypothetical protein